MNRGKIFWAVLILLILSFLSLASSSVIFIGDLTLNNDSYKDIILTYSDVGFANFSIYWGSTGEYNNSNAVNVTGNGSYTTAVADLNNDGYLDIVLLEARNNINSSIRWGSNDSSNWNNITEIGLKSPTGISIADLNNDGYLDMFISSFWNGVEFETNSSIFWGDSDSYSWTNTTELPVSGGWGTKLADLNYDGYLDIIVINELNSTGFYEINSSIYWNNQGSFQVNNKTNLSTIGAIGVDVADLNNDGYLDIIVANANNDASNPNVNSTIFWGDSDSYSWTNKTGLPTHFAYEVTAADFNKDGYIDLYFSNNWNGTFYNINSTIYWNNQGSFQVNNKTEISTYGATTHGVADLNNDGYLDIIQANTEPSNYNTTIFWNNQGDFNSGNISNLLGDSTSGISIAISHEGRNTAYGSTVGATTVPDFRIKSNSSLNNFIDLDVFFYNTSNYTISIYANGSEYTSSNLTFTINSSNHLLSINSSEDSPLRIGGLYLFASNGTSNATSNNFSTWVIHLEENSEQEESTSPPPSNTGSGSGGGGYILKKIGRVNSSISYNNLSLGDRIKFTYLEREYLLVLKQINPDNVILWIDGGIYTVKIGIKDASSFIDLDKDSKTDVALKISKIPRINKIVLALTIYNPEEGLLVQESLELKEDNSQDSSQDPIGNASSFEIEYSQKINDEKSNALIVILVVIFVLSLGITYGIVHKREIKKFLEELFSKE